MTQHPAQRLRAATHRQQGAALIVTVLLMMVISLLALTAMTRNNLDERMAFNQRDRQVALQAAEAALRQGEAAVLAQFGTALDESFFFGMNDCASANGWCYPILPGEGWTSLGNNAWTAGTTTFALSATANLTGVSSQPRYIIEYQGAHIPSPGLSCEANFLITARATGLNANSTVTLQSQVRRRIGSCQSGV